MRFFRSKDGDPSPPSPPPPLPSTSSSPPSITGPARPIRFVYCDDAGKFRIDPEAMAVLQLVKDPIGVVAVCGRARQGKSFILNQLIGRSNGFQVASTHRPCTKGLWLWSAPIKKTALDGTDYNLILLDSEGIDAYDQTGTYSTQIFSLAVLLSSLFIYNQMGGIDEAALDRLSLVTEMTKHIRVRTSGGKTTASELGQFSPIFVWLLRDFYLDLVEDNSKITPRDYLEIALRPVQGSGKDTAAKNEVRESIRALFPDRECFTLVRPLNSESELQQLDQTPLHKFRPEFRAGLDALTRFVFERTRPKQIGTSIMNGPILAGITQSFLDALNNGAVPTIASSWQSVEETECRKAYDLATEVYICSFNKSKPPEEVVLREAHDEAVRKALSMFNSNAVGIGSIKQKYERLLQNYFKKEFESYKKNAFMEADLKCSTAVQDMEKRLRAACHDPNADLTHVLKVVDDLLSEYDASCHGPGKDHRKAIFLQQSFEGPISDLVEKQINQIESNRSALVLKCYSIEDKMSLLTKQLEASEKQKSEYLKRYEEATNDKKKLTDDYMNRISNIQSKSSSVEEKCSALSKSLDLAKKESLEWKQKYEQVFSKLKAEEDEVCAGIAALKSRACAAEASLAAVREQAQSAKEEAEEWKRKYDAAAKQAKSALEKATAIQESANKSMQTREDLLRAEFAKKLTNKEEELKNKVGKIERTDQQLTTLMLQLKASELKVKDKDTELAELKSEIKVLGAKLETANATAQSYEKEAKSLEQEKNYLEEKYRSEFMMFDELRDRCSAAENQARKATEIADKSRAEEANALREKDDIQRISMERLARIGYLERQIEKLERQKLDLTDELSATRASEADAKTKVGLLEARVEEREKEIESLMKSNNAQRSSTVQVLEGLLETERNSRAEANRRAEALSVQLQATHNRLDSLQQELTSVRLNESALEAKLKSASHGKRSRVEELELEENVNINTKDTGDDVGVSDRLTRVKKKLKSIISPFKRASPEGEEDSQKNLEDHTQFTIQRLKQELVKHNYGAEVLKLANPSRKQVLTLYETCVLKKL
ncbi:hypothetical protein RND81_01G129400 [Saponaria officinalis]|uniref:GB1/RHD3-type G domain-containing protein n=1 Tax=Saponaria officinalis TaxID=3572 RepID=A0AAW1N749_SAPOF